MSSEEAPAAKKARVATDWDNHKLNCEEALVKDMEAKSFTEIVDSPVASLQGIGPVATSFINEMKIETVKDLAEYKYYQVAKAIQTLAATEGERPKDAFMNIDKALDKASETKSFKELLDAPLSELEGLTDKANEVFKGLKVTTIGELASFKYCSWAEAMVTLAKFEETKTSEERKQERLAKQLA